MVQTRSQMLGKVLGTPPLPLSKRVTTTRPETTKAQLADKRTIPSPPGTTTQPSHPRVGIHDGKGLLLVAPSGEPSSPSVPEPDFIDSDSDDYEIIPPPACSTRPPCPIPEIPAYRQIEPNKVTGRTQISAGRISMKHFKRGGMPDNIAGEQQEMVDGDYTDSGGISFRKTTEIRAGFEVDASHWGNSGPSIMGESAEATIKMRPGPNSRPRDPRRDSYIYQHNNSGYTRNTITLGEADSDEQPSTLLIMGSNDVIYDSDSTTLGPSDSESNSPTRSGVNTATNSTSGRPGVLTASLAESVLKLSNLLIRASNEASMSEIMEIEAELRSGWLVDEMCLFVEGFLLGAGVCERVED